MVGKEEFKRIKLVCDEKYYEAFANAVGCCCLQKKDYPPFCWESRACQGHSATLRQHKETPPPTGELFPHRFLMKSQFLIAIQGLEIGN